MTTPIAPRRVRRNMRRAVVLFPSGLTLGNLFFGIFAIITASRGDFRMAGIYVIIGGLFDVFDGRVARAANAGTEFGEELDSLVDAISFGFAPAAIMYFAVLNRDGWDWIFVFAFTACAVMRLARFNIEQAGSTKTYFQGLPSPAAGITLASYYWFSQSWLYSYGAIGDLPWQELLRFLMAALAFLMISNVPYPVVPRIGFRSLRAIGASILVFGSLALLATKRLEFFFPLCVGYVAFGLMRSLFYRIFERRQPTIPYDLSEGESDIDEDEEIELAAQALAARHARDARIPREDRTKKLRREESADRPVHIEERPARGAKPERGERPVRTEEERAARREKREKRDKREGRGERPARPARPERGVEPGDAQLDIPAVALSEVAEEPRTDEEVIGRIPAGVEPGAATIGGEPPSPPRKRKRRRRRGERKERGPGDGSAIAGDGGDDDGPDDGPEASAPRESSAFPASMPPIPAPAPTPAPPAPPTPAPSPSSTEPSE